MQLLKSNKVGYFRSAMLAGIYIGIGVMLIFIIGGLLTSGNSPATKIVIGLSFGVSLSLILVAGAELFTGNNFIMAIGSLTKSVSWFDTVKVLNIVLQI